LHSSGSTLPESSALPSVRSQRLETAFHYSASTASFRKPPRRNHTLPAYLFRATLNSRLARSAANSRPRVRSLSRSRSTLTTRYQFTIQNSQANRLRPLPFGISSRRIVALRLRRTREAYLNVGPIFPLLPETGDRESIALFPDHRSRFATFIRLTALFTS
jgi:hypothetical protein